MEMTEPLNKGLYGSVSTQLSFSFAEKFLITDLC
jgi:hypothetical protein